MTEIVSGTPRRLVPGAAEVAWTAILTCRACRLGDENANRSGDERGRLVWPHLGLTTAGSEHLTTPPVGQRSPRRPVHTGARLLRILRVIIDWKIGISSKRVTQESGGPVGIRSNQCLGHRLDQSSTLCPVHGVESLSALICGHLLWRCGADLGCNLYRDLRFGATGVRFPATA